MIWFLGATPSISFAFVTCATNWWEMIWFFGVTLIGGSVKRLALYFTAPYEVSVREEALPLPAAGQVLVQTLVSAISAGTELLIYRGHPPADICMGETIPSLAANFSYPLKYGYATIGRVAAVGGGVDKQWQGKTVFAFQPHQSHFLSTPAELIPVPS